MKTFGKQRREYPDGFQVTCIHCGHIAQTILLGERHVREEHEEPIEWAQPLEPCKQDPKVWPVVLSIGIGILMLASVTTAQTKPRTWAGASFQPSSAPNAIVSTQTDAAPMKPGEVREIGELAPYEWSPSEEIEQPTTDPFLVDYRIYGGRRHVSHVSHVLPVRPAAGPHPIVPHPAPERAPVHSYSSITRKATR